MVPQHAHTGFSKTVRGGLLPWLLVLALAAPQQVWGWGNTGHEAVAYVAWQQLNANTQKRVMQLLAMVPALHNADRTKSIPGFADWVNDLPCDPALLLRL